MAASASARLQNVTKPTGCTVPTNKPLVNAQQQNAAGAGVTCSTGRSLPRPKTCGGDALIFAPHVRLKRKIKLTAENKHLKLPS